MTQFWMIQPQAANKYRTDLERCMAAEPVAGPSRAAEPLNIVAGVAQISINGVLLGTRDRWLDMFGVAQTGYDDILAQVVQADADEAVGSIEFQVDSPGGEASNALIAAADAIWMAKKPTRAVVGEMAASAGYWLASQADTIAMSGPASMVGSIGVAVDMRFDENDVSITSTDAPKKRPDIATSEGQADVRKSLDDLHDIFRSAVARGRKVGADTVNRNFGQGGVQLTAEALESGMADTEIRSGAAAAQRDTVAVMDLETLKSSHPETYALAVDIGKNEERTRVCAHLKLAETTGIHAESAKHIEAGLHAGDNTVVAAHQNAQLMKLGQATVVAENAPPVVVAPVAPAVSAQEKRDDEYRRVFAEVNGIELPKV